MSLLLIAAALLLLRFVPARGEPVVALALLAGLTAGLTLPDIDQSLALGHRSGLTHSILPAALAMAWRWAWPVAAGIALGLFGHLAADVFPNAMVGYATIKLPLAGSLDAADSYLWIGISALLALALGLALAAQLLAGGPIRLFTAAAAILIGLSYLLAADGGWWALAAIVAGSLLLLRYARWRHVL